MGYRVASSAFIVGITALLVGALVHRISAGAFLVGGIVFVIAGAMVLLNTGDAGVDMVETRRRWNRRWLPWVVPSKSNDRAMMTVPGLLAIVGGIVLVAIAVALMIGYL